MIRPQPFALPWYVYERSLYAGFNATCIIQNDGLMMEKSGFLFFMYKYISARFAMLALIWWDLMLYSCCLMLTDAIAMVNFKFWALWFLLMFRCWWRWYPVVKSCPEIRMNLCLVCGCFDVAWTLLYHCLDVCHAIRMFVWWLNMMNMKPCCCSLNPRTMPRKSTWIVFVMFGSWLFDVAWCVSMPYCYDCLVESGLMLLITIALLHKP